MTFKLAARTTLADSVLEQLLEQFQSGILKPGHRLPPERELMEQFGVGRSTIREALQSLARMSLIESRPGAGTIVKPFDLSAYLRPDIFAILLSESMAKELLEAREAIEIATIGLAAQRARPEDLAEMERILDDSVDALVRNEPTYELSALFHVAVAQAAHNTVLLSFMQSVYQLLRVRGTRTVDLPNFLRWEIGSHRELYELIRAGNVTGASNTMRAHLRHSAHQLGELPSD